MSKTGKDSIIKASDGGASTVKFVRLLAPPMLIELILCRSAVLDDIQSTAIWPKLYDGRALIGESCKDYESGMSVKDNVEKFKEAAREGDESRKIIWW